MVFVQPSVVCVEENRTFFSDFSEIVSKASLALGLLILRDYAGGEEPNSESTMCSLGIKIV